MVFPLFLPSRVGGASQGVKDAETTKGSRGLFDLFDSRKLGNVFVRDTWHSLLFIFHILFLLRVVRHSGVLLPKQRDSLG